MRYWAYLAVCLFILSGSFFIYYFARFRSGEQERLPILRLAYLLGGLGVLAFRIHRGYFSEMAVAALIMLATSYGAYELTRKYLRR